MPSTWQNSNKCFQFKVSFLKTFPTTKNLAGYFFNLDKVDADKTVVCVLSNNSLAFSSSHLYPHPLLPVFPPFSCTLFTTDFNPGSLVFKTPLSPFM